MTEFEDKTVVLWSMLHDGGIDHLLTDLGERTLTFVIDLPFHREFHNLPEDTRIRVVGEGVRYTEAFIFEPWPHSVEPPPETPWKEAQERRKLDWAKGRYISSDWHAFADEILSGDQYEILSAELNSRNPLQCLSLGVLKQPSSEWRNLEVRAERFRYFVAEREFTVEGFVDFGNAYWDSFQRRANAGKKQMSGA